MKKLIVALLVGLVGTAVAAALSRQEVVEKGKQFTVLIGNSSFSGGGLGSGVLLDHRHVLTCFHLIKSSQDDLLVYTYPLGKVYPAHIDGADVAHDVAFLVLDTPADVTTWPRFATGVQGEPIVAIGNSLGVMKWMAVSGIVSGISQAFVITDALVQPGYSGGPWLNEKGEIVALTDWGLDSHPGVSGGISSAVLAADIVLYFNPPLTIQIN